MASLREKFKNDYLVTWWDKVKFYFLLRKVYKQKIISLWEANLDKLFFESQYADQLGYDDAGDRKIMAEERKKPLAEQNQYKIADIEERISHAKAIKQSFEKNERFRAEVMTYLEMLDLWKKQD